MGANGPRAWTRFFEEELGAEEEAAENEEDKDEAEDGFEVHPLYQASFALTVWIDQLFEEVRDLQSQPGAVKLSTHVAIASAKLAAALSDDDVDEIGMTIAYLKRALKAVITAIDGANAAPERRFHRTCRAFRHPQPAPFPDSRWGHSTDGRVPNRVAPAFRGGIVPKSAANKNCQCG